RPTCVRPRSGDSAMRIDVRRATVDDARAIAEVHVASWRGAYRGIVPDEVLDARSVEERTPKWRAWLTEPGSRHVLVAAADGRVRGFVAGGPSEDADADATVGQVYALYVAPPEWTRGVGRALLRRSCDALFAEGFRQGTLWVLQANGRG